MSTVRKNKATVEVSDDPVDDLEKAVASMNLEEKHPIKDWMEMLKTQKGNIQPLIPLFKKGYESVLKFINKAFSKKFNSEDLAILYGLCVFVFIACCLVLPISSAIYIWASSLYLNSGQQ